MKLRIALLALMLAFPLLYLTGAVLQYRVGAIGALVLVAVLCVYLLGPERKA